MLTPVRWPYESNEFAKTVRLAIAFSLRTIKVNGIDCQGTVMFSLCVGDIAVRLQNE